MDLLAVVVVDLPVAAADLPAAVAVDLPAAAVDLPAVVVLGVAEDVVVAGGDLEA